MVAELDGVAEKLLALRRASIRLRGSFDELATGMAIPRPAMPALVDIVDLKEGAAIRHNCLVAKESDAMVMCE